MPSSSTQLSEYVGAGESLKAVYDATLTDRSGPEMVTLGLTDRRLFYVSEEGSFGNVGYSSICSVQGRPQTTRTYRLDDYRLVMGTGVFGAVLGFVGVVGFASSLLVPFLLLAAVCGLVSAEWMRRHADDIETKGEPMLEKRLEEFDIRETLRKLRQDVAGRADLYQLSLLGSGLLGVASFLGIFLVTSSVYVALGMLLLVGGIGLADYAYRHRNEFEGFDVVYHHETAVSISTDDDQELRFRVDSSEGIYQEMSQLIFGEQRDQATI